MNSSSKALPPAKTEETVSHHQSRYIIYARVVGISLVPSDLSVYSATCSFNSCEEQSDKDSVRETSCWNLEQSDKDSVRTTSC